MDGIATVLNTTYEPEEVPKIDTKEVQTLLDKSNELKLIDPTKLTIEDNDYLKLEIKDMIQSMTTYHKFLLEQVMRPPIRASEIEAVATISRELKDAIKELRLLNMDNVNINLAQRRISNSPQAQNTNIQNNVFMLDSKSLDAMIDNATKNKAIDSIEIDFKTDEQIK